MDKIFKQKFEKFEPKVPDSLLDNIMNEIDSVDSAISSKLSYTKLALWIVVSVAAVVLEIVLLQENKTKETIINQEIKNIQANSITNLDSKKNENLLKIDKSKDLVNKQTASENDFKSNNNQVDVLSELNKNKQTNFSSSNKSVNEETEDSVLFNIIADRYICNGESTLSIDENYVGEWSCNNKSVVIDNVNSNKTLVHFSGQDKVQFSYLYQGNVDTFTVFFQKPIELAYKISPVTCGKKDGEVEIQISDNRQLVSVNNYQFVNNSFINLSEGAYTFELKDNMTCTYKLQLNLHKEDLKGEISYNASGTMVGSSIRFKTNIDITDANYTWDFGDETQSFDKSPEHKYNKQGSYDVKLRIDNKTCTINLALENFKISDKGFDIPNIFTPNNDGKNDVFEVSVPDDVKSFNAVIMSRDSKLVYQWSDSKDGWDGLMINGQEAASGTYYYIITGVDKSGESFEYKSFIELRR